MPLYPSIVTTLPFIVAVNARGVRFTVSPSRSRIVRDAARVVTLTGKYGDVLGDSPLMAGIIAIPGGIGAMRQLTADVMALCSIAWPAAITAPAAPSRITP